MADLISVIIPVYNQREVTMECLNSIETNTTDYELVIIDNGSTEKVFPQIADSRFEVVANGVVIRVIRNDTNLGFPVAVNQGIRAARGDVIVLLNNDVIVTPGALNRLANWLDDYAIVGPMTNYCAGLQRVTIGAYSDSDELIRQAEKYASENMGSSIGVRWVIGFCMAFKKSLYDDLGEFDESLWPCSGEEIDFCYRASAAGYGVGIAQDVYVHHFGSQTFGAMQKAGEVDYNATVDRNNAHLAEKWGMDFLNQQLPREAA